jgi:hypothetical protein
VIEWYRRHLPVETVTKRFATLGSQVLRMDYLTRTELLVPWHQLPRLRDILLVDVGGPRKLKELLPPPAKSLQTLRIRGFNRTLHALPPLSAALQTLELRFGHVCNSTEDMHALIHRLPHGLTDLNMGICDVLPDMLRLLMQRCPHIDRLSLTMSANSRFETIDDLRALEGRPWHSLSFFHSSGVIDTSLFTRLETMNWFVSVLRPTHRLAWTACGFPEPSEWQSIEPLTKLPPTLEHLEWGNFRGDVATALSHLIQQCPRLDSWDCGSGNPEMHIHARDVCRAMEVQWPFFVWSHRFPPPNWRFEELNSQAVDRMADLIIRAPRGTWVALSDGPAVDDWSDVTLQKVLCSSDQWEEVVMTFSKPVSTRLMSEPVLSHLTSCCWLTMLHLHAPCSCSWSTLVALTHRLPRLRSLELGHPRDADKPQWDDVGDLAALITDAVPVYMAFLHAVLPSRVSLSDLHRVVVQEPMCVRLLMDKRVANPLAPDAFGLVFGTEVPPGVDWRSVYVSHHRGNDDMEI